MPLPGSQQTTSQPDLSRSEHSATYLTPAQLATAQRFTAAQKAKAMGDDISGTDVEKMLAEIVGGQVLPGRGNRPQPDLYRDDIGYSVKTIKVEPVAIRPKWQQWLGQSVSIPTARVYLRDNLPRGRTLFDVSPSALGKRLVEEYNASLENYGVAKLAVLVRLDVPEEQLIRYLYWEEDLEPLNPSALIWSNSTSSREGSLTRNVRAHYRDQVRPGADRGAGAISWASNGSQLYKRHYIPADADTWTLPYSMMVTREEATQAILRLIDQKQLG